MMSKREDNSSLAKLCNPLEERNIQRVFNNLDEHTFNILLDHLSQAYVLERRQCNEMLQKTCPIKKVQDLLANLESCTDNGYRNFIELMQFKEETFVLGCHMAATWNFCCNENTIDCQPSYQEGKGILTY